MEPVKSTDWKTEPLPEQRTRIALDRVFSAEEMERVQRGFMPRQQEDKWFIFWEDGKLYCHRSWTGYCVYIVNFLPEADGYRMVEAEINRDDRQYSEKDDRKDAELISYLIDLLLLRRRSEFPAGDPSSESQAIQNWGFAGRAMFDEDLEQE